MIIQPISYFGQPVISAAAGAAYSIRSDAFASSVVYAVPGTQFGSTFGQTSYRSDISSYVRGTGSSYADIPITGSQIWASGSANFTTEDYTTSLGRGSLTNYGAWSGTNPDKNFGDGSACAVTVECWVRYTSFAGSNVSFWNYNNGFGFGNIQFLSGNSGYVRFVRQASNAAESLRDYNVTVNNNQWYHCAWVSSGTTNYVCFNGIIGQVWTTNYIQGTTAPFQHLGVATGAMPVCAWQDYRVTKAARYTGAQGASYTIPGSIVVKNV